MTTILIIVIFIAKQEALLHFMQDSFQIKNFLEIPYDQLEEMNLKAKEKQQTVDPAQLETEYRLYLQKEKRLKAVTLCFTDIEGRFHMLDYDKKYLLEAASNLTFDGSSIRGFTPQHESDLRLQVDWPSIIWLPSDIFGSGKVVMFANVLGRDKTPYISDFRGQLKAYTKNLNLFLLFLDWTIFLPSNPALKIVYKTR